jgi:hypothetical protein
MVVLSLGCQGIAGTAGRLLDGVGRGEGVRVAVGRAGGVAEQAASKATAAAQATAALTERRARIRPSPNLDVPAMVTRGGSRTVSRGESTFRVGGRGDSPRLDGWPRARA